MGPAGSAWEMKVLISMSQTAARLVLTTFSAISKQLANTRTPSSTIHSFDVPTIWPAQPHAQHARPIDHDQSSCIIADHSCRNLIMIISCT